MATQAADMAAYFISNEDKKAIVHLVKKLADNPFIEDVMIYGKHGDILYRSENSITAKKRYHDDDSYQDFTFKPVVVDIESNDKRLGFLRVTYIEKTATLEASVLHENFMRQTMLMMILAGCMGFLLTRAFSRFSRLSVRSRQLQKTDAEESSDLN